MNNWIIPESYKIPDFIIVGGMKCGTTSIHEILNSHPKVYIPKSEIHYFDLDDISEHPEFAFFEDDWVYPDYDSDPEKYWNWYSNHFSEAKEDQIIGEDSTIYMSSRLAAERIAAQNKKIKILMMMRQPSLRAYSHYWHDLRAKKIRHSFENELRYNPKKLLERSEYKDQIEHYLKYFSKEDIKFVIFEEFLNDKEAVIKDICEFLELDYSLLAHESLNIHANKAQLPKFTRLQLISNLLNREAGNRLYTSHFPYKRKVSRQLKLFPRLMKNLHSFINPYVEKKAPKIDPKTKDYLDNYFKKKFKGLSEIIGKDIDRIWFE